jgi:hypothetical protein
MIKQATLAGVLLSGLVLAGPVLAEEGATMCPRSSSDQLMTKDQLAAKAKEMGYDVRGIKATEGCWEVKGFDKNGNRVEFHIDPVTADIKMDQD